MTKARERGRDVDRFLTFIDAVVAIAITLLVLPLADLAGEVGHGVEGGVAHLLNEHRDQLLAFFLSFVVIARLWLAQHVIVSGLIDQSRSVLWLMLAWVLTIVFLPFPTALVAETSEDPTTKALYIGTMGVNATVLALLAWAIARDPAVHDDEGTPDPWPAVASAAAFFLALLISLVLPSTGYYPLLLLAVSDHAQRYVARVLRRPRAGGG